MSVRLLSLARFPVWPGFLPDSASRAGLTITTSYASVLAADANNYRLVELKAGVASHIFFGASAPADDSGSVYVPAGGSLQRILPAATAIFAKGAEEGSGSVETWSEIEFSYPSGGDI